MAAWSTQASPTTSFHSSACSSFAIRSTYDSGTARVPELGGGAVGQRSLERPETHPVREGWGSEAKRVVEHLGQRTVAAHVQRVERTAPPTREQHRLRGADEQRVGNVELAP